MGITITSPAITALTGDVTATGPGSAAATIANGAVTNAKHADMATQTFKGRTTAGTGAPEDLTITQAQTLLRFSNQIRLDGSLGVGSAGSNKIRVFANLTQTGSGLTFTSSSANSNNGDKITIGTAGIYAISCTEDASGAFGFGISKNASSLTTACFSLAVGERMAAAVTGGAGATNSCSWVGLLAANDIIRVHTDGTGAYADPARSTFSIVQVA